MSYDGPTPDEYAAGFVVYTRSVPTSARLICALCAIGLLAGCGDGGSTAEVDVPAPELVAQAAEALSAQESYRARFDGTIGISGGEAITGGLLGREQPISGEARVSGEDAAVDLAADLGITNVQLTLTRTGNGVWLGLLGQDYTLDLPAETLALLQPRDVAPTLVSWIADPEIAGTESVDGVDVAIVTGTVDPDAILANIATLSGAAVDEAAAQQIRAALTEGSIELWVGIEDRLPRRVRADVVLDGRIDAIDADGASLDIDLRLSDFDEALTIAEPTAAQPFSFDALGGFGP